MTAEGKTSRWSKEKYPTHGIPTYLPQEMLLEHDGKATRAVVLRAQLQDMERLREAQNIDIYYARRREYSPNDKWDAKGHRVNVKEKMFLERMNQIRAEITNLNAEAHGRIPDAQTKEIVHKIYFTRRQMEERLHGALIGVRGKTQQELERETNCRILLAGKGISNNARHHASPEDAGDKPHCKILAPDEETLQRAIAKIQFLLSDDPEAEALRDENRRRLAIANGTYREDLWRARNCEV